MREESRAHLIAASQEEELVEGARQGDAEAFGRIYEGYLDRIYRYAYFKTGSVEDAQDLAELTFLKAWEALPKFVPRGGGFRAWLFRIAHNVIIDHFRNRPSLVQLSEELPQPERDADDGSTDRSLEVYALREAMQQLNPDERNVILLHLIEGFPHRVVARMMGRTEGATRVLQYRALRKLAHLYAPGRAGRYGDVALSRTA